MQTTLSIQQQLPCETMVRATPKRSQTPSEEPVHQAECVVKLRNDQTGRSLLGVFLLSVLLVIVLQALGYCRHGCHRRSNHRDAIVLTETSQNGTTTFVIGAPEDLEAEANPGAIDLATPEAEPTRSAIDKSIRGKGTGSGGMTM